MFSITQEMYQYFSEISLMYRLGFSQMSHTSCVYTLQLLGPWSMVLVDVTGASEVPPKNICHRRRQHYYLIRVGRGGYNRSDQIGKPRASLLRVVVARVRPLSQSCSSPTRRLDQEVDARRGVVMSIRATRRVLNVLRSACGAIRQLKQL